MIEFTIDGIPQAKERPRFSKGTVYTPNNTVAFERAVGILAKKAMGKWGVLDLPCIVSVVVKEAIPKSWPKWKREATIAGMIAHTKTPDVDNIAKSILDGMEKFAYKNDSQVFSLSSSKQWSNKSTTTVTITPVDMICSSVKTEAEYQAALDKLT